MKYYTFVKAPNPRRVELFMNYKGINLETHTVDLFKGEHLQPEFLSINPNATVPALQVDDNVSLVDAISIRLYLESLYPDKPLCGRNPLEQAQIVGWDHRIFNDGILAVAEVLRNKEKGFAGRALTGTANVAQIPALIDRGHERLQRFFQVLDDHLSTHQYIVTNALTIADIDALVTCDFAGWIKQSIPSGAVNLKAWYGRISQELGLD